MIRGIIGRKIGMTQAFDEEGRVSPVTVIQAGPCVVVQRKTKSRDGYEAVQLGLVETRSRRNTTKAIAGHFAKAGLKPVKHVREIRLEGEADEIKLGQEVRVGIFKDVRMVDVTGTSKGKGFQGVVKRYGFKGGRATHGSMFHRAPGGIGASAEPSRVLPGARMPGRMGGERVTVKNLQIVRVIEDQNLLLVRGAVPGSRQGYLLIRESGKSKRKAADHGQS